MLNTEGNRYKIINPLSLACKKESKMKKNIAVLP